MCKWKQIKVVTFYLEHPIVKARLKHSSSTWGLFFEWIMDVFIVSKYYKVTLWILISVFLKSFQTILSICLLYKVAVVIT